MMSGQNNAKYKKVLHHFTLEYWVDDRWYVGKLKEIPGVISQGETLKELETNICDAYQLMMEDEDEDLN